MVEEINGGQIRAEFEFDLSGIDLERIFRLKIIYCLPHQSHLPDGVVSEPGDVGRLVVDEDVGEGLSLERFSPAVGQSGGPEGLNTEIIRSEDNNQHGQAIQLGTT